MSRKEQLLDAVSRAGVVRIRTIANNPLWLCALVIPTSFVAALTALRLGERAFAWVFVGLAVATFLFAIGFICYFALVDPDRLQSEEYQLHLREINLRFRQNRKPERYNKANQPVQYLDSHARIENGEHE